MTRFILPVLLALVLAVPTGAAASTTADQPFSEWLEAAAMPADPILEIVGEERCAEAGDEPGLGCTDMKSYIALGPEAGPHTFLHEEGHVFAGDHIYGNPEVEARVAALIDHPRLVWYEFKGNDSSLDEAFADAFARCGLVGFGHPIIARWPGYSVGSVMINGRQMLAICEYIQDL